MLLTDLRSKKLIVLKGWMFAALAVLSAGLLIAERPALRTAALVVILVWSACRFYYFLFYVLATYVDPALQYSGIFALLRSVRRQKDRG